MTVIKFRGSEHSGLLNGAGGVGGLLWVSMNTGPAVGTHLATYDGNGNLVSLVSATTGTETARYEYGPSAEPIRLSGTAARANRFRFSTKRTDDTTDLILYEYRAYSSSLGRWLSRDPIGRLGGQNLYALTVNNPVDVVDYLGLKAVGTGVSNCIAGIHCFIKFSGGKSYGFWPSKTTAFGLLCCKGIVKSPDDWDFPGSPAQCEEVVLDDEHFDIGYFKMCVLSQADYDYRFGGKKYCILTRNCCTWAWGIIDYCYERARK